MKRLLLVIGILLIAAAAVWKFGLSQRWTNRYQDQWTWEIEVIGQTGYPDESGNYPDGSTLADDPINLTTRSVVAEATESPTEQVLISDHFEARDAITDEVTWEYTGTAVVDAATGRHADGDYEGDYYFFPRNVDPDTTYVISNSSYQSLPMSFQGEESVGGMNTYLYAYHGDLENTEANAAFVTLEPGQEVYCFDFALEYWVEPVTGEIVKYREWCEGDWVVDADGERLYTISRWGGETSGDDIIRQVTNVQNKKLAYMWASLYAPLAALVLGVVLSGVGVFSLLGGTRPQTAS